MPRDIIRLHENKSSKEKEKKRKKKERTKRKRNKNINDEEWVEEKFIFLCLSFLEDLHFSFACRF